MDDEENDLEDNDHSEDDDDIKNSESKGNIRNSEEVKDKGEVTPQSNLSSINY
jgi:hypothetical protein